MATTKRRAKEPKGLPEADTRQALRKRAEALAGERAGEMPENLEVLSPKVARRALHELRVHQIELDVLHLVPGSQVRRFEKED
jgi:hypothetical protein